ncbi:MAG: DnaD domain protein [Clostridiales bacterium]|nr:DnaD domain protein [Clostridiales bacterium]
MTCSYAKEFSSSAFTDVENAFICEYLPISSGDTVRVYLYGLFLCQHPERDQDILEIASTLKMEVDKVKDCFKYWEEFGLVSVLSEEPFSVQYLPVHTSFSSKPRKIKAEKYTEFTKGIQALLPTRMISTGEYTEYFSIMETYGIKPEAMLMIVKYCADRKGTDIGYRYVSKVAKDFGARGITTVEKVEKELSSYILRTGVIEKILKALSLKRQPEIEDSTLLKKWTQELNFDTDSIIFAASKLKKGSMAKLDEFIMELYSLKSFSQQEIEEYMNKKQAIYELAIKINKALSIYVEVMDTVVDTYTHKWLSYGFTDDALLFIASNCFKSGKNTLQDMDGLVETLRQRGFIDLSSVGDYFEQEKKMDAFISKLLITAGINRRPNPWDRENLQMWKGWNFSEDMILEAAKLASGKSSPIAYMNGILSNWKNKGVFSIENVPDVKNSDDSQESYNREYERRRSLALSRAQKNMDKANEIDGFTAILGRLSGIEKDLAFAEISGDQTNLKNLEKEQAELNATAEKLLRTINLTMRDLSPRFACEKCSDTGYVGTHRCDCFNNKVQ